MIDVATAGVFIDRAQVTDLEIADFDRDGLNDIAAAWFLTDFDDSSRNRRALTIWWGTGRPQFERGVDFDLYIPDPNLESLSVFRNGPGEVCAGDFDGDDDKDLAVLPFFGDELWLIENLGGRQFAQHLKFPFFFNSTGNFQTPPEAAAADFDNDGRDELVCVADPIQHIFGLPVHFWRTDSDIASMERVEWLGLDGGDFISWIRSLAVGDFNGDGHVDLAISGSTNPTAETDPIVGFWFNLNPGFGLFQASSNTHSTVLADIEPLTGDGLCRPGLVCADSNGSRLSVWSNTCSGPPQIGWLQTVTGFAGTSPNRGMAIASGDVNGDGLLDIVTRQRLGTPTSARLVEIALGQNGGTSLLRVSPSPLDTTGFGEQDDNEILRPRNLAVADLFGNRLPEIIAAFGPPPLSGAQPLRIAIWANSCEGDITRDGLVTLVDLSTLLSTLGCAGDPAYAFESDLSRDGCVNLTDLSILLANFGCSVFAD
ncbi:MAG: FG-GAP-like repeat-containing protein [Phycisphaerae bacterium]